MAYIGIYSLRCFHTFNHTNNPIANTPTTIATHTLPITIINILDIGRRLRELHSTQYPPTTQTSTSSSVSLLLATLGHELTHLRLPGTRNFLHKSQYPFATCVAVCMCMHVNCTQHWINAPEQKSCTFSPSTNNGWVVMYTE